MQATTQTTSDIRSTIGKKNPLADQYLIADKVSYSSGISLFDEALETPEMLASVVHVEIYPKGFLFKLAWSLGFKTLPFALSNESIKQIVFEKSVGKGQLIFQIADGEDITFNVWEKDFTDVEYFLKNATVEVSIVDGAKLLTSQLQKEKKGALEVSASYFPLAWFFSFSKPIVDIQGIKEKSIWGTNLFTLKPGKYKVTIYFPYFNNPRCGANAIEVDIKEGKTQKLSYHMPPWMFSKGKIKLKK